MDNSTETNTTQHPQQNSGNLKKTILRYKDLILISLIVIFSVLSTGIYIQGELMMKVPQEKTMQVQENETTSAREGVGNEDSGIVFETASYCYDELGQQYYCGPGGLGSGVYDSTAGSGGGGSGSSDSLQPGQKNPDTGYYAAGPCNGGTGAINQFTGGCMVGVNPNTGFADKETIDNMPSGSLIVAHDGIVVYKKEDGGTQSILQYQKENNGNTPPGYEDFSQFDNTYKIVKDRQQDPAWYATPIPVQDAPQSNSGGDQTGVNQPSVFIKPPGGSAPKVPVDSERRMEIVVTIVPTISAGAGAGNVGRDGCPPGSIGGAVAGQCVPVVETSPDRSGEECKSPSGGNCIVRIDLPWEDTADPECKTLLGGPCVVSFDPGAVDWKWVLGDVIYDAPGEALDAGESVVKFVGGLFGVNSLPPQESDEARIVVSAYTSGVGTNTNLGQNPNPVKGQNLEVQIFDIDEQLLAEDDFEVPVLVADSSLPTGAAFSTYLSLGTVEPGNYRARIRFGNTLWKTTDISLAPGTITSMTPVELIPGDIDGDNVLTLYDYMALVKCYRNNSCPNLELADLNLDGIVDELDLNIMLSSFSTRRGD